MKKFLWALLPFAAITLSACGGKNTERKVMIVANGDITISGNHITISNAIDGAIEKVMDLKDAAQTTLELNNNGAKSSINIAVETGYYVLNLMKDSVFGSKLIDGIDYNTNHDMGLDAQKAAIDSIKLVLAGKNISAANNNFLISPGQLIQVTKDLTHARVFGPFHALSSDIIAPADGKPPVLYKFYATDELQTRLNTIEASYNTVN